MIQYKTTLMTLALLLTAVTGAWAQTEITTIPNGDFETWTYDGEDMPNYWNSNATSDGSLAAMSGGKQLKRSTDVRPGSSGQYSCSIWSKSTMGVINIGILTSGRIHFGSMSSTNNANYIYSDRDGSNTKNNFTNPCAMPFTGKPTAIKVWVKYVQGGTGYGNYATAKFSATIHGDADYVAYNLAEHDNDDNKALVVASAEQEIAYNNGEWEQLTIPFNYTDNNVDPAYILINAYTNAYPGKGKANDYLYIDDIELEYAPEPGIDVTPSETVNQWTFTMPANDVVLTPIYSAATIYSGETETPFETLKEAFANVKNGDVIKLDWNVTLTETVETLLRDGAIKFTLDLNGYIIDGTIPEDAIRLRNGDYMTITDSSLGQTGGFKCQNSVGEYGAKFIFDGGRYTIGQLTADFLNTVCSEATAALLLAPGKEFTDIENAPDADGFTLRVGFKTFDLAIDSKRFATFYSDMNITFAEQPAQGVGLYTISSIDADRSTATVTPISGIIPAGTPMLVYNDTEQEQTAKLVVTLDNAQDAVAWAPQFKGTATDHEFTAADMAAADYYALSGGKAFAPVKGAGTLGANQCWLQFDKQEISSARQFTLVFDETTGLSGELRVKSEEFATATWYTIDGRKVAAPSKKGIYIMNGRKVVK